jgi:hypothetical protein
MGISGYRFRLLVSATIEKWKSVPDVQQYWPFFALICCCEHEVG